MLNVKKAMESEFPLINMALGAFLTQVLCSLAGDIPATLGHRDGSSQLFGNLNKKVTRSFILIYNLKKSRSLLKENNQDAQPAS